MAEINGSALFAQALKREGVEYVFTLNGGHIYPLYEGCEDAGIKVIDFRHEQVAAHAAEGWAKVTGKPGVCIITAGPGVTDAVTGIANAFQAPSPMVTIGGNAAIGDHLKGGLQDLTARPSSSLSPSSPNRSRARRVFLTMFQSHSGMRLPAFLGLFI